MQAGTANFAFSRSLLWPLSFRVDYIISILLCLKIMLTFLALEIEPRAYVQPVLYHGALCLAHRKA